jgi:hypothetical protein
MERNTRTTLIMLEPGDRFYKTADKKKTVIEVIEFVRDPKRTLLSVKVCPAAMKGNPSGPSYVSPGTATKMDVIFLRNVDDK